MPDNTIQFPNSPGIDITITRGGTDPITGETRTDHYVQFAWTTEYTDDDGDTHTVTETRGFVGP